MDDEKHRMTPSDWIDKFGDLEKYDPRFNKDGWHLSHWFGDKRHFRPWYDDNADYNTNAKSYYDYLGFRIRQLDYIIWAINSLMRRDVQVQDTTTIDMSRDGDWLKGDDVETVSAVVKLSEDFLNALEVHENGLYVKDLEPEIDKIRQDLAEFKEATNRRLNDDESKLNQLSRDLQNVRDGLDGLRREIKNLQSQIHSILDRLNGHYKTIPKANWYHAFYNGSEDVPTGWGTFKAGAIYSQNSVTLNVRVPYANKNFQNLKLNGGALPLSQVPESYVVGFGFKDKYSFLNDMKIESVTISNGAPHILPLDQRAAWTIGYNLDHDRKIFNADPYQVTLATFADGYNDKDTFTEHYKGIYLKGDIMTITMTLSGSVPKEFWDGSQSGDEQGEPEEPDEPVKPEKPDEPEEPDEPVKPEKPDEPEVPSTPTSPTDPNKILVTEDDPQGVSDLGRNVTRTINLNTNDN